MPFITIIVMVHVHCMSEEVTKIVHRIQYATIGASSASLLCE